MVGATGPRMLALTLPHVDAWNIWFDLYGNTAEGFAEASAKIRGGGAAAAPGELERSV